MPRGTLAPACRRAEPEHCASGRVSVPSSRTCRHERSPTALVARLCARALVARRAAVQRLCRARRCVRRSPRRGARQRQLGAADDSLGHHVGGVLLRGLLAGERDAQLPRRAEKGNPQDGGRRQAARREGGRSGRNVQEVDEPGPDDGDGFCWRVVHVRGDGVPRGARVDAARPVCLRCGRAVS